MTTVGRLQLRALWQATRPHNALAAVLSTTAGMWMGFPHAEAAPAIPTTYVARHDAGAVLAALLLPAFAVAAANLFNDAHDVRADRLNAPHRPIPSGRLSVGQARSAALGCAAVAIGVAVVVGRTAGAFVAGAGVTAVVAALAYSPFLKSSVLLGNVWVAALSALTLPFGALVVGEVTAPVAVAGASLFLLILMREILKSLADVHGDRHAGLTSVATRYGATGARMAALIVLTLFLCSLSVPLTIEPPVEAGRYLLLMLCLTGLPLATAWWWTRERPTSPHFAPAMQRALQLSKGAGVASLVGFVMLT